jgi:hypothetical protein
MNKNSIRKTQEGCACACKREAKSQVRRRVYNENIARSVAIYTDSILTTAWKSEIYIQNTDKPGTLPDSVKTPDQDGN